MRIGVTINWLVPAVAVVIALCLGLPSISSASWRFMSSDYGSVPWPPLGVQYRYNIDLDGKTTLVKVDSYMRTIEAVPDLDNVQQDIQSSLDRMKNIEPKVP